MAVMMEHVGRTGWFRHSFSIEINAYVLAIGGYCVATGALMLVAPHQFASPVYAELQKHLAGWGLLFLLAGVLLMGELILPYPRSLTVITYGSGAMALLGLAAGLTVTESWTGIIDYTMLGLGMIFAAIERFRMERLSVTTRGDLLGLCLGGSALAVGLLGLGWPGVFRSAAYDPIRPFLVAYRSVLLAGGVLLVASNAFPRLPRAFSWAGHGITGAVFLALAVTEALPMHAWMGILYHGGFGLALILLPLLRARLRAVDPRAFWAVLAFSLGVATALPLILLLSLLMGQVETLETSRVLNAERGRADGLSLRIAIIVDGETEGLQSLASNPILARSDLAAQALLLRAATEADPSMIELSAYDATGRLVARSGSRSLGVPVDTTLFENVRRSRRSSAELLTGAAGRATTLEIGVPIHAAGGSVAGMLVSAFDTMSIAQVLAHSAGRLGQRAILVDRSGQVIMSGGRQPISVGTSLAQSPVVFQLLHQHGQAGAMTYRSGQLSWLAGYNAVPGTRWGIVEEIPTDLALAPLFAERDQAFAEMLAFVALFCALGAVAARLVDRPLAGLGHAIGRFSEGDATVPLPKSGIADVRRLVTLFGWLRAKVLEDATERDRIEAALRVSEERFEIAFRSNPVATAITLQADGRIIAANNRLLALCGRELDDVIGRTSDELGIWASPDGRRTVLQLLDRQGAVHDLEISYRTKSGALQNGLLSMEPIQTNGQDAILVSVVDITERKMAEDQIRDSHQRLENALVDLQAAQQQMIQQERLRALGELASGIAHDFNNALSQIMGFSELLLVVHPRDIERPEKVREYLQLINTSAQDAANVVGRLREFYRHRENDEQFEPMDLSLLIAQAVSLTRPRWRDQARASGQMIEIATDFSGDIPPVTGNSSEIRDALTNLIFNAVDAMPEGGTITIRLRATAREVILAVGDTGVGMTEEVRRRCLEPFFTTKGARGSGLGLAMVYGTIQRHAGAIEIESEVGQGTTITVRLPIDHVGAGPASLGDEAGPAVRVLRILVVEDEALLRRVLREFLTGDGHLVSEAANGREGFERFQNGAFDLVITDRAMPDMNGDQLAASIKQTRSPVPIMMLTGFGEAMIAESERPAGVDLVVAKPITLAKLREALAAVVG